MEQKLIRERYRVIAEIARGGMGVVYLATDLLTNSKVALKTNTWSSEPKIQKAFETEAKLLARLNHAGLPKVRDYFTLDNTCQALVMDFVEGETLIELLESAEYRAGCALDTKTVVDWGIQILDILCYLHRFTPPVIHRDIKPNNIKLKRDGTIVLLDFGLAKGTAVSNVSGGSSYSSLEQLSLTATDARSDIYALGTTLYHLLTNYYPLNAIERFRYSHNINAAVLNDSADRTFVQNDPQKTVSQINVEVPPEVSEIVMKAMSLFPEDRFQTAEEMKSALHTAKQNMDDSFSARKAGKVGAVTNIDNLNSSVGLQSLLDDEEIIGARISNKENIPNFEHNDGQISGDEPIPVGDIAPTMFVIQPAVSLPNRDFTTFDVKHPTEIQSARKPNRKTTPLLLGISALILLPLAGFVGWVIYSPSKSADNIENVKPDESSISPLQSGRTTENSIEISVYSVKKDGTETKLGEKHLFENEEQFRFGVKSANEGFLYVISRNNQDKAQLAYPLPDQVDNSIKKISETSFPRDGGKFQFNKNSPSEMWAYFVVVKLRESDLAKRIRIILGDNREESLFQEEVGRLLKDLDKIADDSAENSTNDVNVRITKLQKKQ